MKNKRIFSFNEEEDAEKIISEGFSNGNIDYIQMYLVAKYFREVLGYGKIRLEREIIKFCKNQDKNFNPVVEADSIKKWIKSAMSYGLRKIESVSITQKEIEFLKDIPSPREKKLLFITLLFSKALKVRSTRAKKENHKTSDKYYIRYGNLSDIIRLSGITGLSETDLANIYFKYKNHFTFYSPEKELIRIDFADKAQGATIEIHNLEKASEHYDMLFGKNIITCEKCGRAYKKTNGRQIYCKDCSKEVRREKTRERKVRWREKSKGVQ